MITNMSKPSVLNNVDHKDLKIDTRLHCDPQTKVNRCNIYATEIHDLHKEFPLVFYKNPETHETQLHAILGLAKDENLFMNEQGWITRFTPASLAIGPFSLGYKKSINQSESASDPVICVDLNNHSVNTQIGEPLFLPFGGETPYLENIKMALQTIASGSHFNNTLFTLIESFDLFEPISIQIKLSNVEEINFNDYYTIDQQKLTLLSAEQLAKLNQYGVLSLLFFVLSSTNNFQQLIALKNSTSGE